MQNFNTTLKFLLFTLLALIQVTAAAIVQANDQQFHVLAYHDVVDSRDQLTSDAVTTETLINHFEWLVASGFTPVSVDELIQANQGKLLLPEKPVLLCWDDGYTSFYTHVLPLLKAYNFPAVLALVGDWMNVAEGGYVSYGTQKVSRNTFVSWDQLQEIVSSGLVEIASHSMALHKGLRADAIGDEVPATMTHEYFPATNTYETNGQMHQRIRDDLQANSALIRTQLGISPRVMVWPFGRYNQLAIQAAQQAGMDITLTLNPAPATTGQLHAIPRYYPTLNPDTGTFQYSFIARPRPPLRRFFQVDSGDLLEQDRATEKAFSTFLDRAKALASERVYFSPVENHKEQLHTFFTNPILPMVQDRLLRLTWHTNKRAELETHLLLPRKLFAQVPGDALSPLLSAMGKAAPCSGVLIDSPQFITTFFAHLQTLETPASKPPTWNPNSTKKQRAALLKHHPQQQVTDMLEALTSFQQWQPFLDVGLLITPAQLERLSVGTLSHGLHYFDYFMLDLRGEAAPVETLSQLIKGHVFSQFRFHLPVLLPYADDQHKLKKEIKALQRLGIVDYGYANDDFLNNKPESTLIQPLISSRTYPFLPK